MRAIQALLISIAAAAGTNVAQADKPADYAPPFTPMWAAPQLTADPPVGGPGTVIQIYGAKFHRQVQAFYGNQPMQVIEVGDRYILAVIPQYVRHEDFIYVVDSTGRARTSEPFALVRRAYRHRPRR